MTIPDLFFKTADKNSKKTALLYKKKEYASISYKTLALTVKNIASGFQEIGARPGDKIAILSENRPEWAMTDLAAMALGGVSVPLHTTLSPRIMEYILNHSESKILIVSNRELLQKIAKIQEKLPLLKKIVFLEEVDDKVNTVIKKEILEWEELLEMGTTTDFIPHVISSDDVCTIIYTSGTTGTPKGVELTHSNFLSNVEAVNKAVPVKKNDVFLSFLPLSHVLERMAGYYMPLLSGATIAYAEDIKKLPENLKEIRPTILISVPRVFEKFYSAIWTSIREGSAFKKKLFLWSLKQKRGTFGRYIADKLVFKKIRDHLGGRLRLTVAGGASLNKKIAKAFLKIGIIILEGYGLTETSPVITVNKEKDFKFNTVGKTIEGVRVKISDDKEVLVKGPNVTKGYFKNPGKTQEVFGQEGWFHTGDLGFLDEEGFLTVIGRKKEIIVTSVGKNVFPEAVEKEINQDCYVSQAMVVGNGRKHISALIVPEWEKIKVLLEEKHIHENSHEDLVKDPRFISTFQERINKINQNLSHHEEIVKFTLLPEEFSQEKEELTPTLKLRRHIIERNYISEIERMYEE